MSGNLAAVTTWAVVAPIAFLIPNWIDHNPFLTAATTLPIVLAICLIIGVVILANRWSNDIVAGVGAGFAATWIVLILRSALVGTPYGYGGLYGDMGRTTAFVTRYTTTIVSSDALIPSLPSEYPPFFAWLVGRAAVVFDMPAWQLVGDAEVLFMSASALVGFILWRRLTKDWTALAISCLTMITWSDPRKAYEVITLVIFVPWALEVFGRPPRRRMHWIWAGILGGFMVMTYQAWLVYAALGLIALLVSSWRTEPERWSYVRYLALTMGVAFLVSSWYVVPFVWATMTRPAQQTSDLFGSTSINSGLFPFLDVTPIGVLQLVGLVGSILLWRRQWWSQPLLLVIAGVYGYRLVSMIRFAFTGHTGFLHYTVRLYAVLFTAAGVLVVAHLVPIILDRLKLKPPRLAGAALLAVVFAWTAFTYTGVTMPPTNKYALDAHIEALPGGQYPRYAPTTGRRAWFPVSQVKSAVERQLGADAQPVTLTVDARLFSYVPWQGYIELDRTASATLSRWDDRFAEVQRLAATTDPTAFAAAARDTKFGPIEVFVLRKGAGGWAWGSQRFSPSQFAPEFWVVSKALPENIVVAIRR